MSLFNLYMFWSLVDLTSCSGAAFPRWRGLHHFSEIMAESFNDAMKLDDVVKASRYGS